MLPRRAEVGRGSRGPLGHFWAPSPSPTAETRQQRLLGLLVSQAVSWRGGLEHDPKRDVKYMLLEDLVSTLHNSLGDAVLWVSQRRGLWKAAKWRGL